MNLKTQKNSNKSIGVVIAAAGNSARMGKYSGISKQFIKVNEKPLLIYSLEKFSKIKNISQIIVVTNDFDETLKLINSSYLSDIKIDVISGGELRQDSVYHGFCKLNQDIDLVLIHDVARPLVNISDIEKCIEVASISGSAILAIPVVDTLKRAKYNNDELIVEKTVDRESLYAVQTPQVFSYFLLEKAYRVYRNSSDSKLAPNLFTDEASMVELLSGKVNIVAGSSTNIKITYPEDLILVESMLKNKFNIVNSK